MAKMLDNFTNTFRTGKASVKGLHESSKRGQEGTTRMKIHGSMDHSGCIEGTTRAAKGRSKY